MREKLLTVLLVIVLAGAVPCRTFAQQNRDGMKVLHRFRLWGENLTELEKFTMLLGFTNGYFAGPRSKAFITLADCIEKMSGGQSIAMIDKYYKGNPETWSQPLAVGIISALTVKEGPCGGKNPVP